MPVAAVADTVTPSIAFTNLDEITLDVPLNVCLPVHVLFKPKSDTETWLDI